MDGLRIYFDFTLPTLLLYNFEREQYNSVMKLAPEPERVSKEAHRAEMNGKTQVEDKYGVVSSSTESSPVKQEFGNTITSPAEPKEEGLFVVDKLVFNAIMVTNPIRQMRQGVGRHVTDMQQF